MSLPSPSPAVQIMRNLGMEPDPWQVRVLESRHPRILLNCCRQAGKSTVAALLALAEAVFEPFAKVLILSRSQRQSSELFRQVIDFYERLDSPLRERQNAGELLLETQSRIVCLPCREDTIRGYSAVTLLIIDEAARVPDDLYRAVRPMLAVSGGRILCLSTPYGKRGFFYEAWSRGGDDWLRVEVPASQVPRIPAPFLAQERRALGLSWFRQEYECSFEALEGLVYTDFARCVVPVAEWPAHIWTGTTPHPRPQSPGEKSGHEARRDVGRGGRRVGGIDFGFRNPFAAVWGTLDRDDVLWLTGEHYAREKPLSYHAERLPRDVLWYCDPSGANERAELRAASFTVSDGINSLRQGIAAVSARLESGRLKVLAGRCSNLLAEADLYRWDEEGDREAPRDEHNHALAALRYLVSRIDKGKMARLKGEERAPAAEQPPPRPIPWWDEDAPGWIPLWR